MGNIYFKLGQYAKAIKFYRMALDQVIKCNVKITYKVTNMLYDIYLIFIQWFLRYPTPTKVCESRSCITLEYFLLKWDNTQMLARASSGLCQNSRISKPAFISFYAITHWVTRSGQKRGKNSKLESIYYINEYNIRYINYVIISIN